MAPHFSDESNVPANTTAVAIDRDKNSPHAVRWAIDHLVITNPLIILVHVRHKNQGEGESDYDINQLFIPFRGYCARKGIQMREVILEDTDISKALVDYISKNLINSMVLGAASRNAISSYLSYRKFKHDVPTTLIKSAPEFCSVYVISKGKILTVRTAQRPVANTATPPKAPSAGMPPQIPLDQIEDDGIRGQYTRGALRNAGSERLSLDNPSKVPIRERDRQRSSPANLSLDSIDIGIRGQSSTSHDSFSNESDFPAKLALGSMDISGQDLDFSMVSGSPSESLPQSTRDIEAEMRRLKLELKQTMDMYSTACKEALTAKRKANELHQWKMEEARKFEEARLAEEAALAIAEMEKAKCKAAIEAAEASQRLAEMEAHRRRQAELKAKKEADEKNRALNALAHNDVRYRKYTIEEIEEATEKFSESMKIGEGGYGPVYKGKLDHTPVAIKVLRPDAAQGKKQFQQEVEVLCCIRHPNMVLLLGACPEYGCLVYEYMIHGSLEDRLFRRGNTPPLSWRKRFKIAAEIATALLFLHQAKPEPLVHRDLKPANILLDRNYVSKISDVGLARLVPPSVADSVTQYHMTSAAGTFCYIDPEYQQTGMLTTKSDIYSLGIMLLQIITAKPPMGLAHHVGRAIEKGTFADMLDPAVPDWPVEEALSFAQMALKCVELRKRDRPDLGTVILPELNRLRDLGRRSDSRSYGYSSSCYSHGYSGSNQSQGQSYHSQSRSQARSSVISPLSRPRISSASQDSMSKTSDVETEPTPDSKPDDAE
ncbi:PREDICTED: U-box domain-containing protein 52 isoform X1 [Theobroma cacao]|uniref:RING-type E3 ubiquitin transferase n=1 Tax=Theobroma cacao TaxID=3641 RepID=A0AB32WV23_THECC|nr:PREDICTED: U-box domain-containing protein 52 isoform X1 [Theobroma cacao]